jgi:hypothetical protein
MFTLTLLNGGVKRRARVLAGAAASFPAVSLR